MVDRRASGGEPIVDRSASEATDPSDATEPKLSPAAAPHRTDPDLIGDIRERLPAANREPAPEGERLELSFEEKIIAQMAGQGWTAESVEQTVSYPHRTAPALDYRFNEKTGTRNDDPATCFINKDNSYVVRRDADGDIVQVSDRSDPDWKRPFI